MEEFDLVHALVNLGVDEKTAEDLKTRLHGDDFMNLVNALNMDELGGSYMAADSILRKYNIKLGGSKAMEDYERAQMEALTSGNLFAVQEFINEWLTPVSIDNADLKEGFNYSVEVNEQTVDRVLDWLDENQVEYQANTPSLYNIKCEDRAAAYRVSRALSEIMSKHVVRDNLENEDDIMSEKSNKKLKAAKDKLDNMKERNPVVAQMVQRGGAGAHGDERRKDDAYGRGAKHKGRRFDEATEFAIGDDVMVGEQVGTIKIPHGPNGTIGVILDGELSMVAECEVSRLDEGVIGMTKLNPLFRLRELAGLAPAPFESPEDEVLNPDDPLAAGPVTMDEPSFADELDGAAPVDPAPDMDGIGMDAPVDDLGAVDGMGVDMPADVPLDDPLADLDGGMSDMGGVPGDLPPMAAEPAMGIAAPMPSEAMSQIEDSLNGIQTMLSDIRLSEYKTLVQKLTDLTVQVQNMGRDYLGERRKK